jgi:ABC-type sulfate transport system permease component
MLTWLLGIAVFILLWGGLWRSQPKAAFGVLLGLPLAWIFSKLVTPYVTGMEEIPVWLPPLPIAIIALVLFVFGIVTWLRADNLPPPKPRDDGHGHSADHGGHGHH